MSEMQLLLLDGSNLFLRAHYGMLRQDLRTSTGVPTWATFGFMNTVATLVRRFEPTHLLVAWDKGRSTKRSSIFPDYKIRKTASTDTEVEDPLPVMRNQVYALLSVFGIPQVEELGVEADDIIAKAVLDWKHSFEDVVIVSADHDLQQLIDHNVRVLKPSLGNTRNVEEKWFTREQIIEEYGLTPDRLPEVWALCGDSSDCIDGIPRVGFKTALKLIHQYGSLTELLASNEKKVAGFEGIVHRNFDLIRLDADTSKVDWREVTLLWDHESGDPEQISHMLDVLELNSIKNRWETSTLWRESTVPKRRLSSS